MRWLQLEALSTSDASDALCEAFMELGADGTAVEDPGEILALLAQPGSLSYADEGYAESLGEDVRIRAFFPEFDEGIRTSSGFRTVEELMADATECVARIACFLPIGKGGISCSFVADEDWENGWKKYYKPLKISPRIVIRPSWETYEPMDGERIVSLDPGSAFGTGSHETTALCAERIDACMPAGARVLDLGCGSGILSVIAARLDAGSVEAIDIDGLAVKVAKENCAINSVLVDVHQGELKDARLPQYDFIVANIIADVIASIAPDVPARLAPGGLFVASGIIAEKSARVLDACAACGLELMESHTRKDWCAFVFRCKPVAP